MVPVNQAIASAKKDGKEAFALSEFVTQGVRLMECARMAHVYAQMVIH